MPLLSRKEVLNLKLQTIPSIMFEELIQKLDFYRNSNKRKNEQIKKILEDNVDEKIIDNFIKEKYLEKIAERRKLISDEELKKQLFKVSNFNWGVVQGQLDQKIQSEYVRKTYYYDDLLKKVRKNLYNDVTNYVVCTWFNHWTTVLIEEHIGQHKRVIPTIKNIKGIDIFFDSQPFDLKISYLPKGYCIDKAIKNPKELAIWMFENQGTQRFGSENRLFIILFDKNNPEKSWELKRDFSLIFEKVDYFFDTQSVTSEDEIVFTFNRKTYTTVAKILFITN